MELCCQIKYMDLSNKNMIFQILTLVFPLSFLYHSSIFPLSFFYLSSIFPLSFLYLSSIFLFLPFLYLLTLLAFYFTIFHISNFSCFYLFTLFSLYFFDYIYIYSRVKEKNQYMLLLNSICFMFPFISSI
jgi:hypothetical protein